MAEKTFTEENKDSKSLSKIIVTIVIIIIVSATYLTFSSATIDNKSETKENNYTKSYHGITAEQVNDIINNKKSIVIIDTRSCPCNYNSGHIPTAVHCINPEKYYDYTIKILAYDQTGNEESIDFCKRLQDHTYNDIYYLVGGMNAWKNAGFEIEK